MLLSSVCSEMQFVDAHCHLHFKRIGRVVPLVLDEARRNGIKHFVVNATSTRDVDDVLHMAQQHRDVTACFGIHPYSIDVSTVDADLESLFAFLSAVKVPFCIGEIGMDKTITGRVPLTVQEKVFRKQVEYASSHSIPFVVHCVHCIQSVYDVLCALAPFPTPFLMHGYSGSPDYVAKFATLGAYFSISGYFLNLSPKRREGMNESIRKMPIHCILFESDAPDMVGETRKSEF